jgi:hypothetical protein
LSGPELQEAEREIAAMMRRSGQGTFDGVRLSVPETSVRDQKNAGDLAAWLRVVRDRLNRVNADMIIGLILPQDFEFKNREDGKLLYETLNVKRVIRFFPGEQPNLEGTPKGVWLEMVFTKDTDKGPVVAEFGSRETFKQTVEELFRSDNVGIFGADFELLDEGMRLFDGEESFFDYLEELIDRVLQRHEEDPEYQYRKGVSDGYRYSGDVARIGGDIQKKIIGVLNSYHKISSGISRMDDASFIRDLHAIAVTAGKEKSGWREPGSLEEQERYAGYTAGYLFGILEKIAEKKYVASSRPFSDSRDKELFLRRTVEAQILLGVTSDTGLGEIIARLGEKPGRDDDELRAVMKEVKVLDDMRENNARLSELYSHAASVAQALSGILNRHDPAPVPQVIAELLRVLDLYAGRNEKPVIERFRDDALKALPAATRAIRGAA